MTTIAELTQEQYEALPEDQFQAVSVLLDDIAAGRVSPMTSDNDLTPLQLAAQQRLATLQAEADAVRAAHAAERARANEQMGYNRRDAKSIKRFVESGAMYKSGYYMSLKGEAYDAGSRLASIVGADRPMSVEALAALAGAFGARVDLSARQRKLERRYSR